MLSRVANSLYWLARYLERAEDTARFLTVTHSYAQELRSVSHTAAEQCWDVAHHHLGAPPTEAVGLRAFHRLVFDVDLPNSLYHSIERARENGRGIRDAISSEMWEELNVLYLSMQQEATHEAMESSELALLNRVQRTLHLFQGLRDNTMVRSDEWHFLRLGQFLERADATARGLKEMFGHPALLAAAESGQTIDTLHLATTLRMGTAFEAYSRAAHSLSPDGVASFLLLDARFSRSVVFSIQEIGSSLHQLSGTPQDLFSNDAEQVSGRLVAELRFAAIEEIMAGGLETYLNGMRHRIWQLGDGIATEYFR